LQARRESGNRGSSGVVRFFKSGGWHDPVRPAGAHCQSRSRPEASPRKVFQYRPHGAGRHRQSPRRLLRRPQFVAAGTPACAPVSFRRKKEKEHRSGALFLISYFCLLYRTTSLKMSTITFVFLFTTTMCAPITARPYSTGKGGN